MSDQPAASDAPVGEGRRRSVVREVLIIVVVALVRTFLFQAFWIPSGSMENTLLREDRVVVSKIATRVSGIERGEVVVFRDPADWLPPVADSGNELQRAVRNGLEFVGLAPSRSDRDLVKRVIGVGGDRVVCCDSEGRVTVNGTPLDEGDYVYPGDAPSQQAFDVTVPPGKLWVMGDHRSASGDSRVHLDDPAGPFVDESDVVGRAMWVVWPLSRLANLPVPATFDTVAPAGG